MAAGQSGFILVWESLTGVISAPPTQSYRGSGVELETGGLICAHAHGAVGSCYVIHNAAVQLQNRGASYNTGRVRTIVQVLY